MAKISHIVNNVELAHYYCEYSLSISHTDKEKAKALLQKALEVSPTCVRASILLAEFLIAEQDYQSAVKNLENVLTQNADYVSEILPSLKYCYEQLAQLDNFELFLIKASSCNDSEVDLALVDLIAKKDGISAAQGKLYQRLTQNPSTFLFHRFIQYQIDTAEQGRAKESLILLHKMVGERIKQGFDYRCTNCGYQTHKLVWCCPSCRQWESIKPIRGIEHN